MFNPGRAKIRQEPKRSKKSKNKSNKIYKYKVYLEKFDDTFIFSVKRLTDNTFVFIVKGKNKQRLVKMIKGQYPKRNTNYDGVKEG